jgi:LysR family transcriptional regulator of gallate degradation
MTERSLENRQLRYFLAVVEAGSLGNASHSLNVTESAVSRAIKQLEEAVRFPLFERTPHGMALTVFGASLARHARVIRAEGTRALSELRDLGGGRAGTVSVGTTPSFAGILLPRACAALLDQRTDAHICVYEGLHDVLIPRLLMGELDFIVSTLLPPQLLDPAIRQSPFQLSDFVGIIARSKHPLAGKKRLQLNDLKHARWALPKRPDMFREHIDRCFVEQDLPPPRPSIEIGSTRVLISSLIDNDFVTYAPMQSLQREILSGVLCVLDVPFATNRRQSGIISRKHGSLSPLARALYDEVARLGADPTVFLQTIDQKTKDRSRKSAVRLVKGQKS